MPAEKTFASLFHSQFLLFFATCWDWDGRLNKIPTIVKSPARGDLPLQTANRTKVGWTFTATDISIHRTLGKGEKNKQKTNNKKRNIRIWFVLWLDNGSGKYPSNQMIQTDWYQFLSLGRISARCLIWMVWLPPHMQPPPWTPLNWVSFPAGATRWRRCFCRCCQTVLRSPGLLPLTSPSHLTSVLSGFPEPSSRRHSVTSLVFLPCCVHVVASCAKMRWTGGSFIASEPRPPSLAVPPLPHLHSPKKKKKKQTNLRWRVSSWCFLVYSSLAKELHPSVWHPSCCQVTLAVIWTGIINLFTWRSDDPTSLPTDRNANLAEKKNAGLYGGDGLNQQLGVCLCSPLPPPVCLHLQAQTVTLVQM